MFCDSSKNQSKRTKVKTNFERPKIKEVLLLFSITRYKIKQWLQCNSNKKYN